MPVIKQLLQKKEFLFFISCRIWLTIALQMQAVIVGWQIYNITKDPLSLGMIGLAEAIPSIGVALYAGHIADKKSRKHILLYALLVMLLCSVLLFMFNTDMLILGLGPIKVVWCMYGCIFLHGIARGFYAPTAFAFLSQLVQRSELARAATINSASWQIAAIIGPAMGGICFSLLGSNTSFGIIILLTLCALVSLLMIATKSVPAMLKHESLKDRLTGGIRFVWTDKVMLSAITLDLFAVLFGGAVALLPVFADEILHVGAEGLGWLRAAPSAGASITMIILSLRNPIDKPGIVLLWCVAAFGVCMIVFGLSELYWLSLFALFMSGAFDSISVVIRSNILQLQTPDHMRGRVSAVNTIFIGSSNEIGSFESGVAARLLGTVNAVVFGGIVTLGIVATTALKAKKLRMYEYPETT